MKSLFKQLALVGLLAVSSHTLCMEQDNVVYIKFAGEDEATAVPREIIAKFETLKGMLEDFGEITSRERAIPLHNILLKEFNTFVSLIKGEAAVDQVPLENLKNCIIVSNFLDYDDGDILITLMLKVYLDKVVKKDYISKNDFFGIHEFDEELKQHLVGSVLKPYLPLISNEKFFKSNIWGSDSLSFNKDGKILVSGSQGGIIKLWDISDISNIKEGVTLEGDNQIAFDKSRNILASGSYDNVVKLWAISDIDNAKELDVSLPHDRFVSSVAFSPDGNLLASGSGDGIIKLWDITDIENIKEVVTLIGHGGTVIAVAFNPKEKILASSGDDNTIKLWDISNLDDIKEITTIKGHDDWVYDIAFHPNRDILASGSKDGTIKLWNFSDVNNVKELVSLPVFSKEVVSVAFHPNGMLLASAAYGNRSLVLWNVSDLNNITEHVIKKDITKVNSVVFNLAGDLLVANIYSKKEGDEIILWQINEDALNIMNYLNNDASIEQVIVLCNALKPNNYMLSETAIQSFPENLQSAIRDRFTKGAGFMLKQLIHGRRKLF